MFLRFNSILFTVRILSKVRGHRGKGVGVQRRAPSLLERFAKGIPGGISHSPHGDGDGSAAAGMAGKRAGGLGV